MNIQSNLLLAFLRYVHSAKSAQPPALYFGMQKGRCIGLIGGLGVGAAVDYYTRLFDAHEKQGASLDLVMAHAETSAIFRFAAAGDRAGMAAYLLGFVQRLAAAGAELAVIPAVTPLYCIHELDSISPLPVHTIVGPLAESLASRSIGKVAVFGTRYVMESDLYGLVAGVEFVRPLPTELDLINTTYVDLAETHHATPRAHAQLTSIAHALLSRDHVDAIILAGTDLTLLFNESNTDFPIVDCATLHIDAIVKAALEGTEMNALP